MRISENNYYKNFETEEYIQVNKFKPIQNMTNTCKIELFDSTTGKKKEEIVSENIVSNYIQKWLSRMLMFYSLAVDGGSSTNIMSRSLFGALFLSSSTAAEDADLKYFKGNVIGWADKYQQYTGADTRRGCINLAETQMIDYNSIKYVFDFNTTAGNGTFRTVTWQPSDNITGVTESFQPPVAQIWLTASSLLGVANPPGSGGYSSMCVLGSKLYNVLDGVIYSTLMNNPQYLARTSATTIIEKDLSATDSDMKGIQWDGTNFWCYGDTTDKMYKLDASFNVVTSWSITEATYLNTNHQFICFGGFIYTLKYVNTTTWNLYKFATDGSLSATYNIYNAGGNYASYGTKSDAMLLLKNDDNLIVIGAGTGTSVRTNSISIIEVDGSGTVLADYGCYLGQTLASCYAWNTNYKYFEGAAGSNFYLIKQPMAHTLLPSAITKTSSDFMKISYTLNFDTSTL